MESGADKERSSPTFSIVIPTFGRAAELCECLEAIGRLDNADFEVIVVDDGTPPALAASVESLPRLPRLRLIQKENGGPSSARNAGARVAKGRYLVFTDDDCLPATDWLTNIETAFRARPQDMLGGRTVNHLDHNVYAATSQLIVDVVYEFYNPDPDNAAFFTSNNIALPADLFRDLGGFDMSFPLAAAEDRDFCDRWRHKGLGLAYVAEMVVRHAHPLNFRRFCRQHFNYGRGARHYHWLRAARNSGNIKDDIAMHPRLPQLLRGRLSSFGWVKRTKIFLLLGVWQGANAAGFFFESMFTRKPPELESLDREDD